MSELCIVDLRKSFGETVALDGISIEAGEGELLTLLGPSGCGKSTTLLAIAGLHEPDSGTIRVGDEVFFDASTNRPAEQRSCGVVFQSYAVWPHMSVADNVGYPLKLRRLKPQARRNRVAEMLELVELPDLAHRFPHELSGGQQQRVALARALAYEPQLLLLDEPFSNFDARLRERARDWLRTLQRRVGVTTVFVTHDQDEALSMSDRVVVMNNGRVLQIGTPEEVYRHPSEFFVADFVGKINVLPVEVVRSDGSFTEVRLEGAERPIRVATPPPPSRLLDLVVRPEAVVIHDSSPAEPAEANVLAATVIDRAYLGDHYRYRLAVAGNTLDVRSPRGDLGESVSVEISESEVRLFPRQQPSSELAEEHIDVAIPR